MRLLIGLAIGLLAAGCDNAVGQKQVELPNDLAVHPSFGEKAEIIFAATDEWKRATRGAADLRAHIGNEGAARIRETFDGASDAVGLTLIETWTVDIGIDMALLSGQAEAMGVTEDQELKDVVMHELGHAFGVDHQTTGLMVSSGYGGGCIDGLTLSLFCANYACPSGAAPTCD